MKELIITMGLPGSGKTYYCQNYIKENLNYKYIDLDEEMKINFGKKNVLDIIKTRICYYNCMTNLIDGMFLTNEELLIILKDLNLNKIKKVSIHYWKPDIDTCIYNDNGRRDLTSKTTIKKSILEYPNLNYLKKEINFNDIYVVEHEVVKKPEWKVFIDYNKIKTNNKFLDSIDYVVGGMSGSYTGDTYPVTPDEMPTSFEELDDLLETIYPEITFLQYKKLLKECVTTEQKEEMEYYGGYTIYSFYRCDMEKFYEFIKNNKKTS